MIVEMKDPKKWKSKVYPSVFSLMKHIEANKNLKTNMNSSHRKGDKSFTGVSNFDEAVAILKDGSEEIMKGLKTNVKLAVDKLNKELNTQPEGYVADVQGLFFDVAKVIEGEPEAWYREPWDKVKKPRIKVPIMGAYTANVKTETVIKNASEIIALIKALEDNGFECEMAMIFAVNNPSSNQNSYHEIMIKNYDESFNFKKISAMLHPSFFRRILFREMEIMFPKTLNDGYGSSSERTLDGFKGGKNFLSLSKHDSIEKFRHNVLYRLKGKK